MFMEYKKIIAVKDTYVSRVSPHGWCRCFSIKKSVLFRKIWIFLSI